MQFPGWTNAWTMPIKTRIDMLSTGIRTPIGVKIFGDDLGEIERIGQELEQSLSKIPSTRSVFSERNTGGYFIDIIPDREAIARYGLSMRDVQDVIETAIGGMPIEVTIEGRNRFTINVRYPRAMRQNIQRLKEVLVPIADRRQQAAERLRWRWVRSRRSRRCSPATDLAGIYDPWGDGVEYAQMDNMGGGSKRRFREHAERWLMLRCRRSPCPRSPADGRGAAPATSFIPEGGAAIPLGQIAEIKIVTGPPMIKDEAGHARRVCLRRHGSEPSAISAAMSTRPRRSWPMRSSIPPGYYLKWTGQYELLEQMTKRMKVVVPITLILIIILLYFNFRNLTETFIVLASVPFALVGSIWLMYFLGYNFSTATWVGIIALVGLATETGIVMVLYLDHAYERRKTRRQDARSKRYHLGTHGGHGHAGASQADDSRHDHDRPGAAPLGAAAPAPMS